MVAIGIQRFVAQAIDRPTTTSLLPLRTVILADWHTLDQPIRLRQVARPIQTRWQSSQSRPGAQIPNGQAMTEVGPMHQLQNRDTITMSSCGWSRHCQALLGKVVVIRTSEIHCPHCPAQATYPWPQMMPDNYIFAVSGQRTKLRVANTLRAISRVPSTAG